MVENLQVAVPAELSGAVSVLIVDDSAVVRTGLRSLLETAEDIEIVGEAGDGVLAESMVAALRPDVVLLDVRMPRRDGVETARVISSLTKVVMMTFTDDPQHIRSALQAGAHGYLVHGSFDASTLAHTIRQTVLGAGAFSAQALEVLRSGVAPVDRAVSREQFNLSTRQGELMDLIAGGRSNRDIAGELFLAEKTVKNHVNAIFAKLQVSSRGEAIALWLGNRDAT